MSHGEGDLFLGSFFILPAALFLGAGLALWLLAHTLNIGRGILLSLIRQVFRRSNKQGMEREIILAARGVTFMVIAGVAGKLVYDHDFYGYYRYPYMQLIIAAICLLAIAGMLMFITGAARSNGYRDARLISKYLIQIAVGVVVYYYHDAEIYRPFNLYTSWALVTICAWCVVTGVVKLALVLRGPPRPVSPSDSDDMPHGKATWGSGGGLR